MEFLHENKPNILIVDDDILIAESNKFTIKKAGYNPVGIAVDSAQALALTKEKKPDLVLMDVNLAGADDGIVTAEQIQKIADIPIIFVTAYSDTATIERAKKVAPFAYLIKPFDNRELIVAIETTLYKHSFDKEIKEQKILFETVANFAYEWEFWILPNLQFKYCSPSCEKITGYKAEEFFSNPILLLDIVHPDDKKDYEEHFKEYNKPKVSRTTEVLEFRIINKQGEVKFIRHTCNSIVDENNNYLGRRVTNSDITENKEIENLWRQSEKDYRNIFNSAHEAIIIFSPENEEVLEANDRALEIYGFTRKEFIGKSMRELSKYPEAGDEKIKQLLEEKHVNNFNSVHFRKDGSELFVEINGSLIQYKGKTVILSMNHDITGRVNAEKQLMEKEEFLRRVINNVDEIIYSVSFYKDNNKSVVNFVSEQVKMILGYAPGEFISDPKFWFKIIHPADAEMVDWRTKEMFEEKKSEVLIYRMQHNLSGEFLWIEDNRQLLLDKKGNVIGLFGTARNVTARILSEKALKESQERFQNLFDNSPSAIAIYKAADNGKDFIFTDFNLNAQKTDKMSRDKLIGKRITEIFPSAEELGFLNVFRKVWQTGNTEYIKPTYYRDNRFEGWRENIIYKLNTGEVVAIYNDVTERIKAEISLRQSEQKFKSIFENHSAVQILIDYETGKIVDANNAAANYYGYTRDELKQMNIFQINILSHEEIKKEMENVVTFKKNRIEFKHRLKNGEIRNIEVYSSKIEIDGKIYLHSIIHDITEKVESEKKLKDYHEHLEELIENRTEEIEKLNEYLLEQLRKEKELEASLKEALEKEKELNLLKTRFISTASHEFKTPLTSVLSSTEMLKRYGRKWSEEKFEEHISRIKYSIEYVNKLLDEVLTISRVDSGKIEFCPEEFNLHDFCISVFEEVKPALKENHEFIFNFYPQRQKFILDKRLMNYILTNLLTNAIKYSPYGGKVELGVFEKENYILIEVKDSGIGIPEDEQKYLFERFHRCCNSEGIPGTGLGLSIVKESVELHKGEISVQSQLGKGTTFTVKLEKIKTV